jgi:hypothetical protein
MCGPDGDFLIASPEAVASKMLDASEALGGVERITFQMSTTSRGASALCGQPRTTTDPARSG